MRRWALSLSLLGSIVSTSQLTIAQDQERAPVANAIGRFFGFGYSAGYHAQVDSRYGLHRYTPTHNVVPQPPRGIYAAAPTYGYAPQHAGMVQVAPMMTMQSPLAAPALPSANQDWVPAPTPTEPAKPVEPPPGWLKQFLKDQKPVEDTSGSLLNEASPSDRRGAAMPKRATTAPVADSGLTITPADGSSSAPLQIGGRPVVSILQQ